MEEWNARLRAQRTSERQQAIARRLGLLREPDEQPDDDGTDEPAS
jgi:hypothetical protein